MQITRITRKSAIRLVMSLLCAVLTKSLTADETQIDEYRFTLPDGFEIERAADLSLVKRPISADFDHEGNLYVTEASGTNEHVEKQLENKPHRVLKLSDTDGDGKFDQRTVFVDRIQFPEGALFHRGSLYVTAPPSIWKFTDTDDDGVADKTEEWLNAKTLTYCANDLHGPFAGPDGYIYWCKGAFAEQTWPRADGSSLVTRAAHIFRRPVAGGFVEPVMTGGMDNPVEVAFTPSGEIFFITTFLQHPGEGKRDGIIHAIHGAVYGKDHGVIEGFPRTGDFLPPVAHMGGAAPAGLMMMRSSQFGEQYKTNLFVASFNMHKITSHRISLTGTTCAATSEDFLVCDSFDFHPTDVLEDGDGSLLVIDTGGWYKICCPTSQLYKPEILGGIYRVRRKDSHAVEDPRGKSIEWTKQTDAGLCGLLKDPRFAVRDRAKQRLIQRNTDAIPAMREALADQPDTENADTRNGQVELAVLWILSQIEDQRATDLIRSRLRMPAENALARVGPYRVAAKILATKRDLQSVPNLVRGLEHDLPNIRRSAAEALGKLGDASAVGPILNAFRDSDDRTLVHALTYALIEIGDKDQTRAGLKSGNPDAVVAAITALDQMSDGDLSAAEVVPLLSASNAKIRRSAFNVAIDREDWIDEMLPEFESRLVKDGLSDEETDELHQFLRAAVGTEIGFKLAAKVLDSTESTSQSRRLVLRALTESEVGQSVVKTESVLRILNDDDPQLLLQTLKYLQKHSSIAADDKVAARLSTLADEGELDASLRLDALLTIPDEQRSIDDRRFELIRANVFADSASATRSIAAQLLSRSRLDAGQLSKLAEILPEIGPLEIEHTLAAFQDSTDLETGSSLLSQLPQTDSFHAVPRETAVKLLTGFDRHFQTSLKKFLDQRELSKQQQLAALDERLNKLPRGNSADGQKIFLSANAACSACHTVGYLGGHVGPDLTRIGDSRQKRDLLESVLFPSASFVRGFETMIVTTLDGRTVSGFVRDETRNELVLVTSERKEIRIAREDIEELNRGELSIMPAGLDKQLSDQQLADLLEFLMHAR